MADYKGSPIMQRLLRRQKVRQATAVSPEKPVEKPEKKDADKRDK